MTGSALNAARGWSVAGLSAAKSGCDDAASEAAPGIRFPQSELLRHLSPPPCRPDHALARSRRAADSDARSEKIRKVRELGAHQILDIDSLPFVFDQLVLIGRKRLDALCKAPDKVFRLTSCGLADDCLRYEFEWISIFATLHGLADDNSADITRCATRSESQSGSATFHWIGTARRASGEILVCILRRRGLRQALPLNRAVSADGAGAAGRRETGSVEFRSRFRPGAPARRPVAARCP
jgi:hypothetical protein